MIRPEDRQQMESGMTSNASTDQRTSGWLGNAVAPGTAISCAAIGVLIGALGTIAVARAGQGIPSNSQRDSARIFSPAAASVFEVTYRYQGHDSKAELQLVQDVRSIEVTSVYAYLGLDDNGGEIILLDKPISLAWEQKPSDAQEDELGKALKKPSNKP